MPPGGQPRPGAQGTPVQGIPKGLVAYRKALLEFNSAKQQVVRIDREAGWPLDDRVSGTLARKLDKRQVT